MSKRKFEVRRAASNAYELLRFVETDYGVIEQPRILFEGAPSAAAKAMMAHCSDPRGHRFRFSEDECYCVHCGVDGDA